VGRLVDDPPRLLEPLTRVRPRSLLLVAGGFAFRLLTYWLPVLPGWLAYRALRAGGAV